MKSSTRQIYLKNVIKKIHNEKHYYQEKTEANINRKLEQVNKRIKQAYVDKCDGAIDEDFWREINKSYHAEKAELIEALHRVNEADVKFYDTCEKLLEFAPKCTSNVHKWFS